LLPVNKDGTLFNEPVGTRDAMGSKNGFWYSSEQRYVRRIKA